VKVRSLVHVWNRDAASDRFWPHSGNPLNHDVLPLAAQYHKQMPSSLAVLRHDLVRVDRPEVRQLIVQIAIANPLWRAPRIHGELKIPTSGSQVAHCDLAELRRGNAKDCPCLSFAKTDPTGNPAQCSIRALANAIN